MIDSDRRVYTPAFETDEHVFTPEDGRRRRLMLGAIMAIVLGAIGAVAWNIYGDSGPPPLIAAEPGDYKTLAPAAPESEDASHELDDAVAGASSAAAKGAQVGAPAASAPAPQLAASSAAPAVPSGPFAAQAQGAFLAQIAALRSRDAADEAWRVFTARAPALAQGAHAQVQRADLGAQGVFYRLRVGFFDSHERAGAFCARVEAAGQDCMVVSR